LVIASNSYKIHALGPLKTGNAPLQTISAFRQAGILCQSNQHYALFLRVIVSRKTGQQKRFSEPRMIKRRPKAFPRMQKPRASYHKKEKTISFSLS